MAKPTTNISISSIILDEEIYPRKGVDQKRAGIFAENIRDGLQFDPIEVQPDPDRPGKYRLLDGVHRLHAFKAVGMAEPGAIIIEDLDGTDPLLYAARKAIGPKQLTEDEARDTEKGTGKLYDDKSIRNADAGQRFYSLCNIMTPDSSVANIDNGRTEGDFLFTLPGILSSVDKKRGTGHAPLFCHDVDFPECVFLHSDIDPHGLGPYVRDMHHHEYSGVSIVRITHYVFEGRRLGNGFAIQEHPFDMKGEGLLGHIFCLVNGASSGDASAEVRERNTIVAFRVFVNNSNIIGHGNLLS